ncbi:hypothetical protein BaRGS_00027393 [Batillaria attramentaria]|uniref:Uncharacterized protein n=1 Tax=Batillaria attramentaria TaxID=370345 RepID=A0ABD0K2V8_9CAEN
MQPTTTSCTATTITNCTMAVSGKENYKTRAIINPYLTPDPKPIILQETLWTGRGDENRYMDNGQVPPADHQDYRRKDHQRKVHKDHQRKRIFRIGEQRQPSGINSLFLQTLETGDTLMVVTNGAACLVVWCEAHSADNLEDTRPNQLTLKVASFYVAFMSRAGRSGASYRCRDVSADKEFRAVKRTNGMKTLGARDTSISNEIPFIPLRFLHCAGQLT